MEMIMMKDLPVLGQGFVMAMAERHLAAEYPKHEIKPYNGTEYCLTVKSMHDNGVLIKSLYNYEAALQVDGNGMNIMLRRHSMTGNGEAGEWYKADKDVMQSMPEWYEIWQQAVIRSDEGKFNDWKVGDYILGTNCCCKKSSIDGCMRELIRSEIYNNYPKVLHIDAIKDMTDEELMTTDYLQDCPWLNGFKGGGLATDDDKLPENTTECWNSMTYAQKHVFIDIVMLIRTPHKWVAVNPEGYNYCRYLYFPIDTQRMYAAEIEQARNNIAEQKRMALEQQEANNAKRIAEDAAKIAEALEGLTLKEPNDYYDRRTRINNINKILKKRFPKSNIHAAFAYKSDYRYIKVIYDDSSVTEEMIERFCRLMCGTQIERFDKDGYREDVIITNDMTKYTGMCEKFYVY